MKNPFYIFLVLALASSAALAVAVDEEILPDAGQEAMAHEIMKDVRCLVCQNQSIEDSQADLAKDLRRIVRERVAMGESRPEIEAYLTARYGDWILLEPPLKARTLALWLLPFAVLLVGGWFAFHAVRSRHDGEKVPPLSAKERAQLKRLLDKGDAP